MQLFFLRSSNNLNNDNSNRDESKCDNCHEDEFQFYCKECNQHLCIECNKDIHKRGDRKLHARIEVLSRQQKRKSLSCKVHDQELRWFCKTCQYSICELCCDQNGSHEQHHVILCSTMANDLKSEVTVRYIEVAESKKESIIDALQKLEAMLYEIGVEGVRKFAKTSDKDNTKHVSSLEHAVNNVRAHFTAIRRLAIDMEEKYVKEIEDLAKSKSDAVMNQIKILHADLDQIANCCDAKETMIASPALEACASHSDVMALLDNLEAHMASIKITMDSSISVTVCTSDVLRVLEKSCYLEDISTQDEDAKEITDSNHPEKEEDIKTLFLQSWWQEGCKGEVVVEAIIPLCASKAVSSRYLQAKASMGISKPLLLWHGTSHMQCINGLCGSPTCSLCSIVTYGFEPNKARTTTSSYRLFGKSSYFAEDSVEAHNYNGLTEKLLGGKRAIILCEVLANNPLNCASKEVYEDAQMVNMHDMTSAEMENINSRLISLKLTKNCDSYMCRVSERDSDVNKIYEDDTIFPPLPVHYMIQNGDQVLPRCVVVYSFPDRFRKHTPRLYDLVQRIPAQPELTYCSHHGMWHCWKYNACDHHQIFNDGLFLMNVTTST